MQGPGSPDAHFEQLLITENHRGVQTCIAFIVIEVLFVLLRSSTHLTPQNLRWGWDDYFIFPALVFNVALCIEHICKNYVYIFPLRTPEQRTDSDTKTTLVVMPRYPVSQPSIRPDG